MRIIPFLFALTLAAPVAAQNVSAEGEASFNLFSLEGLTISDTFTFDDGYTERFGVVVPVDFALAIPRHDDIQVFSDGAPDGGAFVQFSFGTELEQGAGPVFLENIIITTASIPMFDDRENPSHTRVLASAQLLENDVLPLATQGFQDVNLLTVEEIPLGDVPNAVQLLATYFDPSLGARMLLRAVALPNPAQPEGYVAVTNINLDLVPVTDGDTLAATMSGRVLSSWDYH